jgi:hypothetical protein
MLIVERMDLFYSQITKGQKRKSQARRVDLAARQGLLGGHGAAFQPCRSGREFMRVETRSIPEKANHMAAVETRHDDKRVGIEARGDCG